MNTPTKVALAFIALAIAGGLLTLLVPVPDTWTTSTRIFHSTLADSAIYALLHIGAAVLFLMGARAYKAGLRRAYLILALGVVFVAAGLVQITIINAFALMETAWVERGGIMLPFLLSGATLYAGVRSMTRQIGIPSVWTRLAVVLPLVAIAIVLSTLLPHVKVSTPEQYFDIGNAILIWDTTLYGLCCIMSFQLRKHMGTHYTSAMSWLATGFLVSTSLTIMALGMALTDRNVDTIAFDAIVILAGLIYIKAGYEFAKTKDL